MCCATSAMRQLRRNVEVAAVFVQRAVEQREQGTLPAPLRPTRPTFRRVDGGETLSSSTLVPRRRVTFEG
jgi:hypothetical protein